MRRSAATMRSTRTTLLHLTVSAACGLIAAFCASDACAFTQPTFVRAWGGPGSGNGQFNSPLAIAVSSAGNVFVGDETNRRIQEFDSAGTFVLGWGPGGPPGGLQGVDGLALGPSGNVYVADVPTGRICIFTTGGAFVSSFGSAGSFPSPNGVFYMGPGEVASSPAGNVYAVDYGNDRIQEFDAGGSFIRAFGHAGTGDGLFESAQGICVGSDGTVFVSDRANNYIQAFTAAGTFIERWGSTGTGAGQFQQCSGLACDSDGNVYVADSENNRIQVFTSGGIYQGQWGASGSAAGQFNAPNDIAIFGSSIYVMDTGNDRVQEFTLAPIAATPTSWGKVKATYH